MAAGVVSFIAHYLTLYFCYASIIAYLARFFCLSPVIPNPKSKIRDAGLAQAGVRLDAVARSRASLFSVYQQINRALAWFSLTFLDLFRFSWFRLIFLTYSDFLGLG